MRVGLITGAVVVGLSGSAALAQQAPVPPLMGATEIAKLDASFGFVDDIVTTEGDRIAYVTTDGTTRAELHVVTLSTKADQVVDLTKARWFDIPQQRGVVINLHRHLDATLPVIKGVESELREALTNLIFNAVRYTATGGHIRIAFEAGPDHAEFRVVDDGIGIDPVHIPRLTERFYRVDRSRSVASGGTGLGLAIVKHALKRLGGELRIESRPGAGSTFSCRFPAGVSS